jgi:hypothetical protein
MGADKNSPQRTRPISQSQLQKSHTNTNCQDNVVMDQLQVLATISRGTHRSTQKEEKDPNNLGKNLRIDRTVCLAAADYPPEKGRTVRKTGRELSAVQKSPPTEKTPLLSKRSAKLSATPSGKYAIRRLSAKHAQTV